MVGMTLYDRLGAIQLFRQHGAYEEMRPGHRTERKHVVGPVNDRGVEALSAADLEADRARQAAP